MHNIRSLFISDVHLGSRHSQTHCLLEFLKKIKKESPPEHLYIVGDFIDGWKLRRSWYWHDESTLVLRKILSFVKSGTQVHYIAGNHDEFLRKFIEEFSILDLGSIRVEDECIHETADGRRLLVIHGDRFDGVVQWRLARWIVTLGDMGYEFVLWGNKLLNWCRRMCGFGYWSMSKAIKSKVKQACQYIGDFENVLSEYAVERECDGVVCGHIHHAEIKKIHDVDYYNTGDWMEECTAIVERPDGSMEIMRERIHK